MTHISLNKGVSLSTNHLSKTQGNKVESAVNNNIHISYPPVDEGLRPLSSTSEGPKPIETISKSISTRDSNNDNAKSELYFLRKVLDIYRTQKIYFRNKKIICSENDLIELVRIITNADSIELETSPIDISCSCFDASDIPLLDVDKIWVITGTDRVIFKHAYTESLSFFDRYDVSLEFIKVC